MQQKWPELNQEVFDSLHPFSFVTDKRGVIIQAGRTLVALHKCALGKSALPNGAVVGRHFSELGAITSSALGVEISPPEELVGEIFRFKLRMNPDVLLRGHVVQVAHRREEDPQFLFSLQPLLLSIDQISRTGLTIADFEVGTPLIDWLMALRSQEIAQTQLREANANLVRGIRMSELLQKITSNAFCAGDGEQLYRDSVRAVCEELGWNVGHVFSIESHAKENFVSTDIWYLSDELRYRPFVERTNQIDWEHVDEFPKQALRQADPVWVSDYTKKEDAQRLGVLPLTSRACAAAVQVVAQGKPLAVVEFISEQPRAFSKSEVAFLSLFGIQLGLALAHLMSLEKERAQLVQLATASKMATLGELAAGVAHEIKNPLSTIGLIVQILKRFGAGGVQSPEKLQEQISRIDLCVDRIASIVRRLNDFSRESSSDPFHQVAVQDIFNDAHALSQARFAARGVALEIRSCPAEWRIDCRPSQVSQILLNLLGNAFDAVVDCAERWVTLECIDGGAVFQFVVCDSGPGIAMDVREKIMNPFFTTKPPGLGVGLGLSISAHIAAAHGGSLRLDESSTATRFILELPKRHTEVAAAA